MLIPTEEQSHGRRLPDRGTRLTDAWQPSPEAADFAAGLGLDPAAVRDRFVDYWIAKPGAGGVKLDWPATWRNWCRRDRGQAGSLRPARGDDAFYDQLAIIARRA